MSLLHFFFTLLWLVCCIYAALYGGRDGKVTAAMLALAVVLTPLALVVGRSAGLDKLNALLIVDGLLLVGLFWRSMVSDRFWPLWLVSFHFMSVIAELLALYNHASLEGGYEAAQAFWSLIVLLVLFAGVMLDRISDRSQYESRVRRDCLD